MAYESPISVWWSDTKIEQLRDEYDNLIVRAVKNVCPNVDKDELIKALKYDRGQYEKGFADGIAFEPPVKTHGDAIRAMNDGMCDGCGRRIPTDSEMYFVHTDYGEECYCEKCAADLLHEEKSDAEILDKFFIHRTVGCDG